MIDHAERFGSPLRALHVVGRMSAGGVENWLMNVLRRTDRRRLAIDFVVHNAQPGDYEEEIGRLGARVFRCLHPRRPWTFAGSLRRVLDEHGPYDAVHSHIHHYSGFVLRLAEGAGVPVRVAHCHSDRRRIEARRSVLRRAYLRLCERWIRRHATVRLACSAAAGESLFGPRWLADPHSRVLHCGVDLAALAEPAEAAEVRAELGLPTDAVVLGHVGRFSPPKNHAFLVRIAAEAVRRNPATRLLLVGDGPLRPQVEEQLQSLGLRDRTVLAGARPDVGRMLAAMDAFVFPSLWEGLPVSVVEAQAAGVPCLIEEGITAEVVVLDRLVQRRRLAEGPRAWATAALETRPARVPRAEALPRLRASSFNVERTPEALAAIYAAGDGASGADPGIDTFRRGK